MLIAPALAAPASWWLWQSSRDGQTFCAQTSPGPGWQKASGPYANARCVKE
ncbi:hypothetical protein [Chitinilyticum litopenaei]|uniref:hypothetical protein n=1 Tax=Chitinilyticum litopenaei TaxID=1121276 RepID=UPI00146F9520|nr:hypothetical protein [Chitinilyticum litopenaei]